MNTPGKLAYSLSEKVIRRVDCVWGSSALFAHGFSLERLYVCKETCCGPAEYILSAELIFNAIEARRRLVSK